MSASRRSSERSTAARWEARSSAAVSQRTSTCAFGRTNTWRASLAFSQSVYSGGRLGALADIAAAGRESAELAVNGARAQLLFDVTEAFYDAALSDRLVRIAEATLAQAEATVSQVQASFEAGGQPELRAASGACGPRQPASGGDSRPANREIAMLRLKQLLDMPAEYQVTLVAPLEAPFRRRPVRGPDRRART